MQVNSSIKIVGVIGAGLMGAGIAQVMTVAGYRVLLNDANAQALEKAVGGIGAQLEKLVEKGKMTAEAKAAAMANLTPVDDLAQMAPADLVIEAVIERLDVKRSLFATLEQHVRDDAILATNTSSLSIAAIGRDLSRPQRLCGMHFFNPVPLMKLVEVIPGPFTAHEVTAAAQHVVARIGKVSVLVKDGPGFLVNLGGRAYYTEALHIEQEGVATPAQIDRIMTQALGFRMGPFALMDLTGIDTNFPVTTYIHQGYQYDPRLKTTALHGLMVDAGRFGRKVGRGFYDYATPPASSAPLSSERRSQPFNAVIPEVHPLFDSLAAHGLQAVGDDGVSPILVAPEGEDASAVAARLNLDPARVVALDFLTAPSGLMTLMTPPVASATLPAVRGWLQATGFAIEVIEDSTGFVAQRILAMIINLAAEMAQTRVASPADIDKGMTLGLNYPKGPLAWGDELGPSRIHHTMQRLQSLTGSERYRPSAWLRRRAGLGLSLLSQAPQGQI